MKATRSNPSKLSDWLRRNTEGTMLMQWISYFMIFSVLIIFILSYPVEGKTDWRFYTTVLLLSMLLLTNILWFQGDHLWIDRFGPRISLWIINVFTTLLVLGAFALTGRGEVIFLLFMLAAQFSMTIGIWPAGVLYCLVTLGASLGILSLYGAPPSQVVQVGAQFMAGMIFVVVITLLQTRSETEKERAEGLLRELQAANIELKAAQQKEKDLAIAEERMRMARDIHDGLGHHLTVLSIQLQAADKLVERNPQAAADSIRSSRLEVKAALEEVRRSVGMMRQGPEASQPLDLMLKDLVQTYSAHTSLRADFTCRGTPYELSTFALQTLFRTVQESLTNIQKHGKGVKQIQVVLEYSAENVRLAVSDDGEKPEVESSSPAGFGLQGLKERVGQLGGEFCCGPGASRGFQVDVVLPFKEVTGDPGPAGG